MTFSNATVPLQTEGHHAKRPPQPQENPLPTLKLPGIFSCKEKWILKKEGQGNPPLLLIGPKIQVFQWGKRQLHHNIKKINQQLLLFPRVELGPREIDNLYHSLSLRIDVVHNWCIRSESVYADTVIRSRELG